jgi:hypothetical protein
MILANYNFVKLTAHLNKHTMILSLESELVETSSYEYPVPVVWFFLGQGLVAKNFTLKVNKWSVRGLNSDFYIYII